MCSQLISSCDGSMADEIMVLNAVEPRDNNNDEYEDNGSESEDITEDDEDDQEFKTLNAQLDQLNSVLDSLEMKTDVVQQELVKLLQSNREARKQFQESSKADDAPTIEPAPTKEPDPQ